jgi:putative membrane protein
MRLLSDCLVLLVVKEHAFFLVLEMFLWTKPLGLKTFRQSVETANASRALQGLYNGFLAAGLLWGLLAPSELGYAVKTFFLSCVVVAGVFGAATVSRRILAIQGVPAAVSLVLLWFSRR